MFVKSKKAIFLMQKVWGNFGAIGQLIWQKIALIFMLLFLLESFDGEILHNLRFMLRTFISFFTTNKEMPENILESCNIYTLSSGIQ